MGLALAMQAHSSGAERAGHCLATRVAAQPPATRQNGIDLPNSKSQSAAAERGHKMRVDVSDRHIGPRLDSAALLSA
eukprot:8955376-Pyramimonas_sp.AAC.1